MDNADKITQYLQVARDNIIACGLLYPKGNNGSGTSIQFPSGDNVAIASLECPGNPAAYKNIWNGISAGAYLQPLPTGYNSASYTNNADDMKIVLTSASAQRETFNLVTKHFGPNEIEINSDTQITFWIKK